MKPTTELSIGALALIGETRGAHVHVAVRGAGELGQRPLCGTVVMTSEEWTSLERAEREVGELREALDMATGPHCSTCGNAVDPDVCHCGDYEQGHGGYDSHPFTPMGCVCGYADPNWKQLATSRGELLWKQRAENARLMASSGPTVADLQAELERIKTTDLGIAVADARRLRAERDRMEQVYEAAKEWRAGDHMLGPNLNALADAIDAAIAKESDRG